MHVSLYTFKELCDFASNLQLSWSSLPKSSKVNELLWQLPIYFTCESIDLTNSIELQYDTCFGSHWRICIFKKGFEGKIHNWNTVLFGTFETVENKWEDTWKYKPLKRPQVRIPTIYLHCCDSQKSPTCLCLNFSSSTEDNWPILKDNYCS